MQSSPGGLRADKGSIATPSLRLSSITAEQGIMLRCNEAIKRT